VDSLVRALASNKDWPKLGITIVQDQRVADLFMVVDRPLFTYTHTYVLSDKRTSIVLDSGKVTAFDGNKASGGIAKNLIKVFSAAKLSAEAK
jgi:hypothetical protein